jgi:hypothetical protein
MLAAKAAVQLSTFMPENEIQQYLTFCRIQNQTGKGTKLKCPMG